MSTTLDIIFPVFGVVIAGYLFARRGWMSEEGLKGLTRFVFFLAIPALLFRTLAESDPTTALRLDVILTYYAGVVSVFLLTLGLGMFGFRVGLSASAIFGMGGIFSNIVLLGIPIIQVAFGTEGMLTFMIVMSVHSIILLPATTLLVELGRLKANLPGKSSATGIDQDRTETSGTQEAASPTTNVAREAVGAVVRNPLLIAIVAGLLFGASGLELPRVVNRFADLVGQAAGPAALFSLGGTLAACRIAGALPASLSIVAMKMFAFPAIVFATGYYVFALEPLPLAVLTVMACLPIGVNVYVMARSYDVAVETATTATIISMLIGPVTLALILASFLPV
ncbi:MAG: AEC family transporter [Pseudomonadota bacterium]